jgi:hypothetical protein
MSLRKLRVLACALGLLGLIAGVRPPPSAAQDDESLELDEDEPAKPAAEEGEAPEEEGGAAAEPDAEAAAEEAGPDLIARAFVGGGLSMRSLRRPVVGGIQRLPTVYAPAADVGLSVRVGPMRPFTLDVLIRYQTSLGLVIKEPVLFALHNEVDVRSEHAEISVAPGVRLGESQTAPRVTIPIGATFRNFWPVDHHLKTPRYTLIGGMARIQLEVVLASFARLRVGPEAQIYGIIGSDLTDYGVSAPGFALGGEASLELRLSPTFLVQIEYRQSNAFSSTQTGPSFLDIERFATVRLAGEM